MAINSINVNNTDSKYVHSIFDISEYTGKTYDTLPDALADVPDGKQKGGMTVSFVQNSSNSDNKYAQYFLIKNTWSISINDWQKINLETELNQLVGLNLIGTCSLTTASNADIFTGLNLAVGDKIKVKIEADDVVDPSDTLNLLFWTSREPVVFRQTSLTGRLGQWMELTVPIETHFIGVQTFKAYEPMAIFNGELHLPGDVEKSINSFDLEDVTTAADKFTKMSIALRKNEGNANYNIIDTINLPQATGSSAGLISAYDKSLITAEIGYNIKSPTIYFTAATNLDVFNDLNFNVGDSISIKVTSEIYSGSGQVRLIFWTSKEPIIYNNSIILTDKIGQRITIKIPIETHIIGIQTFQSYDSPVDFTAELKYLGDLKKNVDELRQYSNDFSKSFNIKHLDIACDTVKEDYPVGGSAWYSVGAGEGNYITPTRNLGVLYISGLLKGGSTDPTRMYAGFQVQDGTYTDTMVIVTRGIVKGRNIQRVDLWRGTSPNTAVMLTQDVEDDQSIEVKGMSSINASNQFVAWHFLSKDESQDLIVDSSITEFFVCEGVDGYTVDDYLDNYEHGLIAVPKYYSDNIASKVYVDDNISFVNHRIDDIASGAGVMPSEFDTDVVMLINYGQSLSVGGTKNKDAADFHKMLTFKGGSNEWQSDIDITDSTDVANFYGNELYEIEQYQNVNLGTTVSANAVAWMQNLINNGIDLDNFDYQFLGSVPGYSGASIATFIKDASKEHPYSGFNCYERLMFSVRKGKELANKAGKTFSVGAVFWVQGEADSRTDSHDSYLAMLRQLITDLNTDIKDITGQSRDIAFIIYQMSSCLEPNEQWQTYQGPSCETWIALQLALEGQEARKNGSNDISRLVYYGSSMYQYDYGTDIYHPADRTVVGLQAGINAEKIINENNPYPVFFIKDYQIQQDTVNNQWLLSLKFDVPVKPMRFYYPSDGYHNINGKQTNYGFRLVNNENINIIASEPEIKRGDTLVIRCTQTPVGCKLSYAVDGHFGGGNLCDSQNQTFVINDVTYHIDNFCPSFKDYIISL